MKTINKFFNVLFAAALVMGTSACIKEAPEYKPADVPTTAEVYFSSQLASAYTLKDGQNYFLVTINRATTTAAYAASISSDADPLFTIPATVNFEAGMSSAPIKISFDPKAITAGVDYKFTITATSEASQYGNSSYSFTAKLPAAESWKAYSGGTTPAFYEAYMNMYNTSIDPHIFDCYVEKFPGKEIYRIVNPMSVKVVNGKKYQNPYYDETGAGDGIWPDEFLSKDDYYIYIDMDGEYYKEDTGKDLPAGSVYIAYSPLNFAWSYGEFAMMSAAGSPAMVEKYSIANPLGKYDASKKCVDFGDVFLIMGGSVYGWSSDFGSPTSKLYFDKNLMVEDYNTYKTKAWAEAYAKSTLMEVSGNVSVRTYVDEKAGATIYQIPDYFSTGQGLAFYGPNVDALVDGAELSDVANEQFMGKLFGTDLYCTVKGGNVSIPAGGLPIFTVTVNVYAKVNGEKVLDYGKFVETFSVTSIIEQYTMLDLVPAKKEDFYGEYEYKCNMYGKDGVQYPTNLITIEDAGQDEEGIELLSISGLGGGKFDDKLIAMYDESGVFAIAPQQLEGTYAGFDIMVYPFSSEELYYTTGYPLVGGMTNTGRLALVPFYTTSFNGLYFYAVGYGGIAINSNYILWPAASDAQSVPSVGALQPIPQPAPGVVAERPVVEREFNFSAGNKTTQSEKVNKSNGPAKVANLF